MKIYAQVLLFLLSWYAYFGKWDKVQKIAYLLVGRDGTFEQYPQEEKYLSIDDLLLVYEE